MSENKFLILPWQKTEPVDPDFAKIEVITSPFRPFQQKVEYRVEEDTSISQDSDELMDEDILFAQEQPYVTPTGIGFKPLLRQLPVQELAKRSDIMITSTLSMSIFSKDKREISQLKRACMKRKDIRQLVHEKNEFLALAKETIYKIGHTKDKDKKYRDNYLRSEIARENFQTATLRNFKNETKKLNSNLKFP